MTERRTGHRAPPGRGLARLLVALLAASIEAHASTARQPSQVEALEWAFRFASAIESDPKDKAKAQELVVGDFIAIGALDRALESAAAIEGWRRGTAYADVATALARTGRDEDARELLERAEQTRRNVDGWEGPRIEAHLAPVHAALGDAERTESISRALATEDERQYAGRAAATQAAARAVRGEFDGAMELVRAVDGQSDFEVAWWRTNGFVAIGRETGLSEPQRVEALEAARGSAASIPGWKGAEALESVAEELRRLGQRESARLALEEAESRIDRRDTADQAALVSNLARAWAGLGEKKHARELLATARAQVPRAMNIDQPGSWGNIAATALVLGDAEASRRDLDRALDSAQELKNSRPRALAIASICRSLGRQGAPVDGPTRARLQALLAGLGEPW